LSGGTNAAGSVVPNYGYPIGPVAGLDGFFQISPIIVGRGGANTGKGGVGCGGGGTIFNDGAEGGAGMAVIISW
jgi:hypothetical protein